MTIMYELFIGSTKRLNDTEIKVKNLLNVQELNYGRE